MQQELHASSIILIYQKVKCWRPIDYTADCKITLGHKKKECIREQKRGKRIEMNGTGERGGRIKC